MTPEKPTEVQKFLTLFKHTQPTKRHTTGHRKLRYKHNTQNIHDIRTYLTKKAETLEKNDTDNDFCKVLNTTQSQPTDEPSPDTDAR